MKKYSKLLFVSFLMFGLGIIVVLVSASIAGGFYSFSLNSNGFNLYSTNPAYVSGYNSGSVILDEFDSVKILSVSENIRFIPSNEFRIEYDIDTRFIMKECQVKNGTLIFDYRTPANNFGFSSSYARGDIDIYYDQAVTNDKFNDFEITALSSYIDFGGIKGVNNLDISSLSQDIVIDFEFNQVYINTITGNIDITCLGENPSKIDVNMVSGYTNITLSDNNVDINHISLSGKSYINGEQFNHEYRNLDGKTNISANSIAGELNVYY